MLSQTLISYFGIDINNGWHMVSIKVGRCSHGIGPHSFANQPIPNTHFWKHDIITNHINRVASWPPNKTWVIWLFKFSIVQEFLVDAKWLYLYLSMVKSNAIKAPIHSIIDIIYININYTCIFADFLYQ